MSVLRSFLFVLLVHTFPYPARARDPPKCACLSCVRPCRATVDAPRRPHAPPPPPTPHRTVPHTPHNRTSRFKRADALRSSSSTCRPSQQQLLPRHSRTGRVPHGGYARQGEEDRGGASESTTHAAARAPTTTCCAPQLDRLTEHAKRELAQ